MAHNGDAAVKRQAVFEISIGLLCLALLASYIVMGSELRYMMSEHNYHRQLLGMALEGKNLLTWLIEQVSFRGGPPGYGGLLVLGFFASCLITGVLAWVLLGRSLDLVPTVCLFAYAAAIVPTLIIATVFWPDGRGHIQSGLLLSVGMALNVLLALVGFALRPAAGIKFSRPSDKTSVLWSLAFLVPLAVLAICTFMSGSMGIKGYDALSYHLPLPAAWAKSGRLTTGFDVQFYYPGNMELLLRWIFAGFSDHYAFIVPFLSGLIAIYLIYEIGRAMGQSRQAALVAASLGATFPVLVVFSAEVSSSVIAAMLMLLGAFFLLRWTQRQQSIAALMCSGLAVGLAAGTKMSVLPQAAVMAIAVIVLLTRDPNSWIEDETDAAHTQKMRRLHWGWLAKRFLFFGAPALFGSFFWYIRNEIREGNPLYPVSVLGLPGIPFVSIFPITVPSPLYNNLLGATFFVVVIPALLFYLWVRRHAPEDQYLSSANVMYFLAVASLLTSANAFTTYLSDGCFAILLSYVFAGELWKRNRKLALRLTIYASFVIMAAANCEFQVGSYLYQYAFKDRVGAARFYIPQEIDSLAPGRVFNATAASATYGLMGIDHRHEVVSLFRNATPRDLLVYQPDYVYLKENQVDSFTSVMPMVQIATVKDPYGAAFSLWRVTGSRGSGPQK